MTRLLLVLLVGLTLAGAAGLATAQPAPSAAPGQHQVVLFDSAGKRLTADSVRARSTEGKSTARKDLKHSSGKGMAILFWAFAFSCVAGAGFVVTRRNMVTAVMGMVGTFMAIAALYMMLFAGFLAAIQVLVYAGAIMVLFVFVIMVLNKPEDEPWAQKNRIGRVVALGAMGYLLLRLVTMLWGVTPPNAAGAAAPPPPIRFAGEVYDWGSTAAVGRHLFTDGLFPFEAISILLLIAVVGAIAVARPTTDDDKAGEGGAV